MKKKDISKLKKLDARMIERFCGITRPGDTNDPKRAAKLIAAVLKIKEHELVGSAE